MASKKPLHRRAPLSPSELDALARLTADDFERINANIKRPATATDAEARGTATARAASAPATNRGGKSPSPVSESLKGDFLEPKKTIAARLVLEDGKLVEIPARRTWGGDNAFLDWVNFTIDEYDVNDGLPLLSDHDIICAASRICQSIYGFGITSQRENGANFYHRSYILGDGYGLLCHGGQRGTILVMLSGEGCSAAKFGWEKRLYDYLSQSSIRAKLTRVDLAHDIYDGLAYNVDRADADFDADLYNCGGRSPNHEHRGNWKRPTGKGRTVYIGKRENGKYARIYEKGKQLGDKESPWVRVEVELKSVNRIIPLETLLHPGQYLAATYPALAWINERQERIKTIQKKTEITYQASIAWAKRQTGALVNVMLAIEGSAEKVVQKLIRDALPKRLTIPGWQFVDEANAYHNCLPISPTREHFDAMALGYA
jgi:phage replication initiation protein